MGADDLTGRRPTVALIAPAGPISAHDLDAGIAVMAEMGADLVADRGCLRARTGYLAGSDTARAAALRAADEAGADWLWMVRGGYGCARTLAALDADGPYLPRTPLVGFSDGTALLAAWQARGVAAWTGPPLSQLSRLSEHARRCVRTHLLGGHHGEHLGPFTLRGLRAGAGSGPLTGGNLALLSAAAGTPAALRAAGHILLVEDVGEPTYRVDRMWQQLAWSGALDGMVGLVLGDFSGVDAHERAQTRSFFAAVASQLAIPVASGLPMGHGTENVPLPLGPATGWRAKLVVDGARAELRLSPETPA